MGQDEWKGSQGMTATIIASVALFLALATLAASVRRQFWLTAMKRQVDSNEAEMRAKWARVAAFLGIKGE